MHIHGIVIIIVTAIIVTRPRSSPRRLCVFTDVFSVDTRIGSRRHDDRDKSTSSISHDGATSRRHYLRRRRRRYIITHPSDVNTRVAALTWAIGRPACASDVRALVPAAVSPISKNRRPRVYERSGGV